MPKFNDIDLTQWKDSNVWTDSLWIINDRDNSGKHNGFYHGNFVPQIPHQLILRFTKKEDVVFDPFLGSGTTAIEAEKLNRNFIGIELQSKMTEYVKTLLSRQYISKVITGDSTDSESFNLVRNILAAQGRKHIQFAILHPPYADIIKFSDSPHDLSNSKSLTEFLRKFAIVLKNTIDILEFKRYLTVVIGDKYSNGEWVPLGFHCLNEAIKLGLTLKSIVVKNMTGNRGKLNKNMLWHYRALSSDYYIFKHEYILIFKKER